MEFKKRFLTPFPAIKQFLIIKELGLFHPNPGWQCAECEYRQACQQWQGQ